MPRGGLTWSVTPTVAWTELSREYVRAIRRAVRQLADHYAPEIEAYMKSNASWTDRTGNARQTLNTEVQRMGQDMVTIILAHGVSYGIFLELANGGAYQVIAPTIDVFGPRIWADVQSILS